MQTFPSLFKKLNFAFFIVASFIVSFVVAANITSTANAATCSYSMTSGGNTINETCLPGPSIRTFTYSATDSTAITKAYLSGTGCSAQIQTSNSTSISSGTLYNNPVYSGVGTNCALGTSTSISISGGSSSGSSGSSGTTSSSTSATTCAISGIGWIVCPVLTAVAGMVDGAYGYIEGLLKVKPVMFSFTGPTFDAWSQARNLSNIGLTIVFLVIIFSQITSIGITNYGVKKMLPRIVMAAILINISYYLVQIAVDVSNILGNYIDDTFKYIASRVPVTSTSDWQTGGVFSDLLARLFGGGALVATAAIMWTSLGALAPVLLAGLVAVAIVFFILIARQALVILLTVLAPLAFLAFLLPNTENLFTKWRKTFMQLLLVYPIISLVFGVSKFASMVLTAIYGGGQ